MCKSYLINLQVLKFYKEEAQDNTFDYSRIIMESMLKYSWRKADNDGPMGDSQRKFIN